MQLKHYLALLVSLVCCSYSYSEGTAPGIVFGQSPNAASAGYNWVMTNILPQQAGLEINGVFYRYTTVKKPEDDMLVHISNLNTNGNGYIFRNTDNWSQLPGNTLQRTIAIPNVLAEYFGDGSIEVEGNGSVEDATVIYSFQFDPCFIPQSSPECPGYKDPRDYLTENNITDPLDDEYIRNELERKALLDDEDEKEKARARANLSEKRQSRLEAALSAVNTALMSAEAIAAANDFFASAALPNTYQVELDGGEYRESIRLVGGKLPDNGRALRNNWAQQLLHEKMIDLQYENLETDKE